MSVSAALEDHTKKKTLCAIERHREDVVLKRAEWKQLQEVIDFKRFVFLDETWAKTNMIRSAMPWQSSAINEQDTKVSLNVVGKRQRLPRTGTSRHKARVRRSNIRATRFIACQNWRIFKRENNFCAELAIRLPLLFFLCGGGRISAIVILTLFHP